MPGRAIQPPSDQGSCGRDHVSPVSPGGDLGGQSFQPGVLGMGYIFPPQPGGGGGAPGEGAGAVSSLVLRVKGTAQAVWVHLELVLEPLGPSDPKAHLLLLRACRQEEPQLGSHPRQACVCAAGVCVGVGGTCQGPWFFRDLCPITC